MLKFITFDDDLKLSLLRIDEDTVCLVDDLYKASIDKEKALYTYLGEKVFEQHMMHLHKQAFE